MVRNGEFTTADVKRVLRKHWWIVPACAMGLGVSSVLMAMQLPKLYTSQTLVLVARPNVSEQVVKPFVPEDLTQRLATMKGKILSRTRLEPVIEKFNLYAQDRTKVHMDDHNHAPRSDARSTVCKFAGLLRECELQRSATGAADLHGSHIYVHGTRCSRRQQ